jgi:hypothetical protein
LSNHIGDSLKKQPALPDDISSGLSTLDPITQAILRKLFAPPEEQGSKHKNQRILAIAREHGGNKHGLIAALKRAGYAAGQSSNILPQIEPHPVKAFLKGPGNASQGTQKPVAHRKMLNGRG